MATEGCLLFNVGYKSLGRGLPPLLTPARMKLLCVDDYPKGYHYFDHIIGSKSTDTPTQVGVTRLLLTLVVEIRGLSPTKASVV